VETTVVDHPIVRARLTVMRDKTSSNAEFRAALRELATLLVYEATRGSAVAEVSITTPIGPTSGTVLANPPLLVPVTAGRARHGRGGVQPPARVADGFRRPGP